MLGKQSIGGYMNMRALLHEMRPHLFSARHCDAIEATSSRHAGLTRDQTALPAAVLRSIIARLLAWGQNAWLGRRYPARATPSASTERRRQPPQGNELQTHSTPAIHTQCWQHMHWPRLIFRMCASGSRTSTPHPCGSARPNARGRAMPGIPCVRTRARATLRSIHVMNSRAHTHASHRSSPERRRRMFTRMLTQSPSLRNHRRTHAHIRVGVIAHSLNAAVRAQGPWRDRAYTPATCPHF